MTLPLDKRIEQAAREIYNACPNGGPVRVPSTSTTERFRLEYKADTWDEAPDRHDLCRELARAALRILPDIAEAFANPITMQDVRLCTGEGKLGASNTLVAVNRILRQRASAIRSLAPKEKSDG